MKKLYLLSAIVAGGLSMACLTSCDNHIARKFGGTVTVKVKKGYKVTEATWKDDQLWYFTEPMEDNYEPKKKEFVESSEYGVLEGKVIFKESR